MKLSLTERWASWVDSAQSVRDGECLHPWTFERLVPELRDAGFATPVKRKLATAFHVGLLAPHEPSLDSDLACGVSFWHLVNLVWQPLLKYIETLENLEAGQEPAWTSELEVNAAALQVEMEGIVLSAAEHLSMDDWVDFIRTTIVRLVGLEVSERLISKVASGAEC